MTKYNCVINECATRASFNFPGKRPEYCKTHRQNEMIDVIHKHCEHEKCYTRANFGYVNDKPKYCSVHKLDNMVDFANKRCEYNGCTVKAIYGYNNVQFCFTHKKDDMTDLVNKKCIIINCNKQPMYNLKGMIPLYCKSHASENMIDVLHKKCKHVNCDIIPVFGFTKGNPQYCNKHKEDNMIDVVSRICIHETCTKQSNFNYNTETTPNYCKTHKLPEMIDIKNKKCPGIDSSGCPYDHQPKMKYDYYCTRCFLQKFPTDPRSALIRKNGDEIKVVQYLQKELPAYSFVHDKPMWIDHCECTHKRRVDLRLLINDTILAIEVDEKQHKDRNQEDETVRYDDLYMIHSGKWIFIRYNPHSYKNHNGKHKNTPSDTRLNTLVTLIKSKINEITNGTNTELIEIHKLYYDGWNDII